VVMIHMEGKRRKGEGGRGNSNSVAQDKTKNQHEQPF
jgi:hypothetical protein